MGQSCAAESPLACTGGVLHCRHHLSAWLLLPYLVQECVGPQGAEVPDPVQHGWDANVFENLGHEARVSQHLPKQCPAHWPKLHHILQCGT